MTKSQTPPPQPDRAVSSVPDPKSIDKRAPPRDGTKIALVLELLRQPAGTTIAGICAATGWQAHTVRAVLAGAVKRRMGHKVISHKAEGEPRRYRLAD